MKINGKYRCPGCMSQLNSDEDTCGCGYNPDNAILPPHYLRPGTILENNYVVGKVIGEGGFGITYAGWDINLEIKVAIKEFFLNGHTTRNVTVSDEITSTMGNGEKLVKQYKEKFLYEARTLASFLSEDGIVSVFRTFECNNTAYIVMEFLEGETLKAYVKRVKRIPVDEVITLFMPIIKSLSFIHSKKMIHRDISPDNIIITSKGCCKLLDFGAAREVSEGDKSLSVILKHGYAPPEQYQSHGNQGPWTDVYALCATIYRCITGTIPKEAVERAMGENLPSPHELVPECSIVFSNIIMRGLEINITERIQSMHELGAEIQRYIDSCSNGSGEVQTHITVDQTGITGEKTGKTGVEQPATSKQEKSVKNPVVANAGENGNIPAPSKLGNVANKYVGIKTFLASCIAFFSTFHILIVIEVVILIVIIVIGARIVIIKNTTTRVVKYDTEELTDSLNEDTDSNGKNAGNVVVVTKAVVPTKAAKPTPKPTQKPKPTPKPTVETKKPGVNAPFYGVWCGAAKEYDKAQTIADNMRSKGFDAQVFITTDWDNLNKEKWYVITAGVYATKEEANANLSSVQTVVKNAYVKYSGDKK